MKSLIEYACIGLTIIFLITMVESCTDGDRKDLEPYASGDRPAIGYLVPKYIIIDSGKRLDGKKWADVVIPSINLFAPKYELEGITMAVKEKEGLDIIMVCKSEGGCKTQYSESFKKANPDLVKYYVGSVLDDGIFYTPK